MRVTTGQAPRGDWPNPRVRVTLGPSGSPSTIGPPRARVRSRTCVPVTDPQRPGPRGPVKWGRIGVPAPTAIRDRAGTATGHPGSARPANKETHQGLHRLRDDNPGAP